VPDTAPRWTRHFISRVERTRTTWKLRVLLLSVPVIGLWLTSAWWTAAIGRGLVCQQHVVPSDAILIENFEPDYFLFERARHLRDAGIAPRVLVPVYTNPSRETSSAVALGLTRMIALMSRIGSIEIIPIGLVEPISLNAARDVSAFAKRSGIRSVVVVAPLFRSRRSALVYSSVLASSGAVVGCDPVPGDRSPTTWTNDWHGIQDVIEQSVKLWYYRLYVLPFNSSS
jgi:hypothetical protein